MAETSTLEETQAEQPAENPNQVPETLNQVEAEEHAANSAEGAPAAAAAAPESTATAPATEGPTSDAAAEEARSKINAIPEQRPSVENITAPPVGEQAPAAAGNNDITYHTVGTDGKETKTFPGLVTPVGPEVSERTTATRPGSTPGEKAEHENAFRKMMGGLFRF